MTRLSGLLLQFLICIVLMEITIKYPSSTGWMWGAGMATAFNIGARVKSHE